MVQYNSNWTREDQKRYSAEYRKNNKLRIMALNARRIRERSEEIKKDRLDPVKLAKEREKRRNYYRRNKHKEVSRKILRKAVRDGLVKMSPCVLCGAIKVQAHHEDYSKPLDVIWLCQSDHSKFETVKRILDFIKKEGKDG